MTESAAAPAAARPAAAPPADDPSVLFRVRDGVGRVTLNRPRSINALDHEMVGSITAALTAWVDDPDVTVVVLDGAGERGFCAGGDIKAVHRGALGSADEVISYWRDEYLLDDLIATYPKPVLALMDGFVMGGGVGLSGHASHRVVTERSIVGMPEVGIGLIPDVGGTYLLARAPGHFGEHLAATTGRMTGADAIAMGFADHYVPSGRLEDLVESVARDGIDDALDALTEPPPASSLVAQQRWIDRCYAQETPADILAALRASAEPEAAAAATAFIAGSPTALTVTVRAVRRVRRTGATLRQAINAEFGLVSHALGHPDLAEGIRAQIIDKDRNPRWQPDDLTAVGDVDAWFAEPVAPPFPDEPPLAPAD